MHSRLYQLLLAFMRCMPVACMSHVCQGLFVVGLCCISISIQYWPNSSCGGPCLLPSLEKGGWRPVPLLHYYLPFQYRDPPPMGAGHVPVSRLKRLDRT